MYTIIEQKGAAEVGSVSKLSVVILADTASDIPTVKDTWEVGSLCVIAEDHSYKILNNEREWV
jgi:hypothetical protein